jgi:hypothetical protein
LIGVHDLNTRSPLLAYVPGAYDVFLIVDLRPGVDLSEFVSTLIEFRENGRELLLASNTTVLDREVGSIDKATTLNSNDADNARLQLAERLFPMPLVALSATEAERIHGLPVVGPLTVRALYSFVNLLQNDLVNSDLVDMMPYFWAFREQALRTEPGDLAALNHLGDRLLPAHHGVDQRTIGAHAGINSVESNVRHLLGGIHKILQAAQAIPLAMFYQYQHTLWTGFVVVGTRQRYWGHHHQALSLPVSYMWEPSRWTGMIHEGAHCLVKQFDELIGRDGFEELARRVRHGWPANIGEEYANRLLLEVLVDVIETSFGPVWDPELILRARWEYLQDTLSLGSLSSFGRFSLSLRAISMWTSATTGPLEATVGGDAVQIVREKIKEVGRVYESWNDQIGEFALGAHCAAIEDGGLDRALVAIQPAHAFVAARPVLTDPVLSERRVLWERDISASLRSIAAGEPVGVERFRHPELLVWGLRKHFPQGMNPRQRTAAILSLVDSYRNTLLSFRDHIMSTGTAR